MSVPKEKRTSVFRVSAAVAKQHWGPFLIGAEGFKAGEGLHQMTLYKGALPRILQHFTTEIHRDGLQ